MQHSRHGRVMALAGTMVLLAACSGERPTAPAAQVQAFGGGASKVVFTAVASVSPSTATVASGATQQFSAIATSGATLGPADVAWSVSGGGTIDANGLFTAGTTAGTFTVTATGIAPITGSATATVTVTVTTPTPTPTCTADDDDKGDCDAVEHEDHDSDHRDNRDGKHENDRKHDRDKKSNKDKGHDN